jgi:hypothetical protein
MKMLKLALAVTLLSSFMSCSRQFKIARVVPGQTYIDTALNILDEPDDLAESSSISPSHQLYIWPDVTLQVDREEVVTAVHRKPASHEKTLQFWQQHYQENETSLKKIVPKHKTQDSIWVFDVPEHGMSAVYNENIDQVTKVILYETRQ